MGICWYCHWGWAKPVADIYDEAKKRLNGYEGPLHFSSSHIVWEDENFDSAEWCLENFEKYKNDNYSEEQHAVVKWSLEELSKIPMEIRCCEPDDYNEENPENFPPPKGLEMVRR